MTKLLFTTLTGLIIVSNTLCANDHGPYIGLGYASTNIDLTINGLDSKTQDLLDTATDSVILLGGYTLNNNLALEGRYYLNASELAFEYELGNTPFSGSYKAESIALYAKPMYDLGAITLYGLLGMSFNNYTVNSLLGSSSDEALFSWGGGAKFNVTESIGLFVDYTDLGESDTVINSNLSSWNLGVSYQF